MPLKFRLLEALKANTNCFAMATKPSSISGTAAAGSTWTRQSVNLELQKSFSEATIIFLVALTITSLTAKLETTRESDRYLTGECNDQESVSVLTACANRHFCFFQGWRQHFGRSSEILSKRKNLRAARAPNRRFHQAEHGSENFAFCIGTSDAYSSVSLESVAALIVTAVNSGRSFKSYIEEPRHSSGLFAISVFPVRPLQTFSSFSSFRFRRLQEFQRGQVENEVA